MSNEVEKAFTIDTTARPDQSPAVAFVHGNVTILMDDEKLVSLNDLWKGQGSKPNREPKEWAKLVSTKEFVAKLTADSKGGDIPVWKTKRGKLAGGTWGHWKVAVEYAGYLDPSLKSVVYDLLKRYGEEEVNPDLKADRAIEGYRNYGMDDRKIEIRLRGKVRRNGFTSRLASLGFRDPADYAHITDQENIGILGMTAKQFLQSKGLPPSASTRDNMDSGTLEDFMHTESVATEILGEHHIDDRIVAGEVVREVAETYSRASSNLKAKFASRFAKS